MRRSRLGPKSYEVALERRTALQRRKREKGCQKPRKPGISRARRQSAKRKPIRRAGKKVKAWESERRKLKKRFEAVGITTCELRNSEKVQHECGIDNYLGFAHSKKRRHIVGDELREVALLCFNAHEIIERLSETEMTVIVREIITARNVRI